jgi:guanosine-3',5'-bis(diphosphate) 3'-pyrophosphohydrolase
MSLSPQQAIRPLLEAVSFAARAHDGQLRKDGETPYVSHVLRVCLILRHVFAVADSQALVAAALHDTLEDTTADFDDLEEKFSREVADWVAALSKDKRLPEPAREKAYAETLASAPWQVKLCKLADIFDNLMDAINSPLDLRARVFQNAHRYLSALEPDLPERAREPWKIVSQLLNEMEAANDSDGAKRASGGRKPPVD